MHDSRSNLIARFRLWPPEQTNKQTNKTKFSATNQVETENTQRTNTAQRNAIMPAANDANHRQTDRFQLKTKMFLFCF